MAGPPPEVRLEPLDVRHAEALFAALDDERVGAYIGGPDVTTVEALTARIVRVSQGPSGRSGETWRNWAAFAGATLVGRVEATLHDGIAEIAYVFGPAHWGNGYATTAVGRMLAELRTEGVSEMWATVDPANAASVRLLARAGFAEEDPNELRLHSFDPGDRTFVLR